MKFRLCPANEIAPGEIGAGLLPDGKKVIFDTYPGQVLWMPDGMQHSWELISGDLRVVAVEVKSAQAAKAAD